MSAADVWQIVSVMTTTVSVVTPERFDGAISYAWSRCWSACSVNDETADAILERVSTFEHVSSLPTP